MENLKGKKKKINAGEMKLRNQSLVLSEIRGGTFSRADLARRTGLTRATITLIVDRLIQEHIVVEGTKLDTQKGRKSTELCLNADYAYVIGLDIQRERVGFGVCDICGTVLRSGEFDVQNSMTAQDVLQRLDVYIQTCISEYGDRKLLGIGITSPGPISKEWNPEITPPNFAMWRGVNIKQYFRGKYRCNVEHQNIANATALAEKNFGASKNFKNFVEVIVNHAGVGAGIILNDKLYVGEYGLANELGHMTVNCFGERCNCGNYGCLELYASVSNLLRGSKYASYKELALSKDVEAAALIKKEAFYLVTALCSIIHVLDIDKVIICGIISNESERLISFLESELKERVMFSKVKFIEVLSTQLMDDYFVLAPCNLILEEFVGGKYF